MKNIEHKEYYSVKILQLNAWGGRIKNGLSGFIADGGYDVVCLQEAIWSDRDEIVRFFVDTVDMIAEAGGFPYVYRSSSYGVKLLSGDMQYERGNVILSKIPFAVTEEAVVSGEYFVLKEAAGWGYYRDKNYSYVAQKAVLENGLTIVNYHGYWDKNPLGNENSVKCMQKVAEFIKKDLQPTVMCGDLNVIPEAPAMRALDFMEDLTVTNRVKTTLRNLRFKADVPCDHILITEGIKALNFQVIDAPVSDHMGLSVEVGE